MQRFLPELPKFSPEPSFSAFGRVLVPGCIDFEGLPSLIVFSLLFLVYNFSERKVFQECPYCFIAQKPVLNKYYLFSTELWQ